jgi:hypothetical protein
MSTQTVLLYGPPLAGKASILRAFASKRGLALSRFDGGTGQVHDVGLRVTVDEQINVGTIWGPTCNQDTWPPLLEAATAFVLVLDPQGVREALDRAFAETLAQVSRGRPGCVVWTKHDLLESSTFEAVPPSILNATTVGAWRRFQTRNDDSKSLVEPVEWILHELESRTAAR